MAGSAAATTRRGLYFSEYLRRIAFECPRSTGHLLNLCFDTKGGLFGGSARSLPGDSLHFPHLQKHTLSNSDSLSMALQVLVNRSIEDQPWSLTTGLFFFFLQGCSVYSNSLRAPSLDFLTNTCGPGAGGEVLSLVAVLRKGSDSVRWQQRQVFNVAAVSLVDFH